MKKNLKTVKTGVVFGLILISMFAVFVSTASAGPLKADVSLTIVPNSEDTRQQVIPASGFISIHLDISYTMYGTGAMFIDSSLLKNERLTIQFEIVEKPEWCVATFLPSTIDAEIKKSGTGLQTILQVSGSENAPAFTPGSVKVRAVTQPIDGLGLSIRKSTKEEIITFNIGYSPSISIDHMTTMNIGPMDTATFPIKIENLGNAPTEVTCQVLKQPDGWVVSCTSVVLLNSKMLAGEGTSTSGTVYLQVRPPIGFGYHYDEEVIQVRLTPSADRHPELLGKEYTLDFTVRSVGFSTFGMEIVLPVVLLIILLIVVIILTIKKKILRR